MQRARALTIAAATSVALVAGMTGPAAAIAASTTTTPQTTRIDGNQRIQLITGDRVVVGAEGQVVGFEPAKGRERIPVQVQRARGHTLVLPSDAQRLIATGKLDQRLFDVTELTNPLLRKSHRDGLKLIVQYDGGAGAVRAAVRSAGDTQLRRTFPSINADAIRTSRDDVARVWAALTDQRKNGVRATASGIGKVWLDGVRTASLDRSVRQIGADKAWEAGYDGKGVKIAVLDTGVDKTHDDLKDQVVGEKNFSASPDTADHVGHGTHVASIAAGTGAKSGGKYKGVAPGAEVISGKVLNDEGNGDDSSIIAGMEWAAAEGADVVNLSLGSPDSPGVDPMEAAVNRLSAEKGILFAVAAGNDGEAGDSTVGSPGSADAALTVGAVDKDDKPAPFSSIGPRTGDGAVKPDVTAPGVAITAAAAPGSAIDTRPGTPHPAPGYLTIDGTSMATPHVAGAAAILKQQHPGWKSTELKGALTASTKGGDYTAYQQGSGRVRVDKALAQSVIADPVSLSFGVAQWPHTDDQPLTKKISYRNLGTSDVTLDLSVSTLDPAGKPAPAGFFKLGATKVTVPAGGKAEVDLTADTRIGDADGTSSGYVTATGAGQSVRTAAAAVREAESYDLTLRTIGRDGTDAQNFSNSLIGVAGPGKGFQANIRDEPGAHKIRVPKGSYVFNAAVYQDPEDLTKGTDWIAQPKLEVTGDTTVTADARTTKPVDITVPGLSKVDFGVPYYELATDIGSVGNGWELRDYTNFRTAHMGPAVTDGSLVQTWSANFLKDATTQYAVAFGGRTSRLGTGYSKHVKASELATLKVGLGASAPGKTTLAYPHPHLPGAPETIGFSDLQTAASTRTLLLSTGDGIKWLTKFDQWGERGEWGYPTEASYQMVEAKRYEAGRKYQETFNTGVFGPLLGKGMGVFRTAPDPATGEQRIHGSLPLFADGQGHAGSSTYTSARSTLYRNGVKVGENDDPLSGQKPFKVDSTDAEYRLTASVERSAKVAEASTRVDTSFTFRSEQVAATTALPVSTVRFAAPVDLASRAPAGKPVQIPVTVQGSAAGKNLKSLTVSVSYDDGKTWQLVKVENGRISVKNPAKDKAISFLATVTDKQGNKSTLTIHNAYYGK
ncbi:MULTISPECIES: S8 family serine peptidase [unclassified Streptomyces]|uniref:S8 family serine peptidase n=1 Tax=Streptomyces sp. NBC_00060 TaxID=2975636 RepID=A0AAU2GUZ4_9ACTN